LVDVLSDAKEVPCIVAFLFELFESVLSGLLQDLSDVSHALLPELSFEEGMVELCGTQVGVVALADADAVGRCGDIDQACPG
jgi:hypothetical protein